MELMPYFVVALLVVPAIAAIFAAVLGPGQRNLIRWISLSATLIDLLLAALLAAHYVKLTTHAPPGSEEISTFQPEFVPGTDPSGDPHKTTWDILRFGGSTGAAASCTVNNDKVISITITRPGANYRAAQPPRISFSGGRGDRAAAATAKVSSDGQVVEIVITNPGKGYLYRPTVHIEEPPALGSIQFYVGLDGINVWLIVLTALLMVPSVLISWNAITERANEYYAWLLVLGAGMLGVFLSFDIILFYVFFELTLVPLFFLIGIWGGPERRHAARKFFIYTLAGSLITFLGLLAIVMACSSNSSLPNERPHLAFAIPELVNTMQEKLASGMEREFWTAFQFWVFLAMSIGFAIKVPIFPLHTWLPLAHVEAPTAGSVILAGVLLKLGTYGFLRFCLPLTPDAALSVGLPLIGTLAVIGIIYGSLCALAQSDIKKIVAYSSVAHLGFCMLGMFALNLTGLSGSLLQMLNHGLSTGALFLLVGMLYERYHTRQLADYGGMGSRIGMMSLCMVFISLSSIGLPGLNGFVGEALIFFGMYDVAPALAVAATAGILLGAWYLLSMVKQVFFGPLKEPHHEGEAVKDLNAREICALAPIMVLCVVLGLYPQPVLDTAKRDLNVIVKIVKAAETRASAN